MGQDLNLWPEEVGFSGRLHLTNKNLVDPGKVLRIRRMEVKHIGQGKAYPRCNNMLLWLEENKTLYYQNPEGKHFLVSFTPVPEYLEGS